MEASDTTREFLVNEMLVKNLGITNPQMALNKEIKFDEQRKGVIVGVMKDFNTRSLRNGFAPMLITSVAVADVLPNSFVTAEWCVSDHKWRRPAMKWCK